MQVWLWGASIAFAALGGTAILADRARSRRRDPDAVGWVPWPLVLIVSILIAAVCVAIALRTGG